MTLSAVQRSGDGFHSNSGIEFFPAGRPVVLWRDARSCLDDVEFFHSDPDAYEADRRASLTLVRITDWGLLAVCHQRHFWLLGFVSFVGKDSRFVAGEFVDAQGSRDQQEGATRLRDIGS